MIKVRYKPGKLVFTSSNKNQYYQYSIAGELWHNSIAGELWHKGYWKNDKYIGYQESYAHSGVKYIL